MNIRFFSINIPEEDQVSQRQSWEAELRRIDEDCVSPGKR